MASLLHDRVSLSLAVEALGEGGAPGGPAGNAPSAVDARAAVFKPDGARFTHASTTLKLFERAIGAWDALDVTAVEVINVTALDGARAASAGGGGSLGVNTRGTGGGIAGEASLSMRACDGSSSSSGGGGGGASDVTGWSVGTWECDLPPSASRNDRHALELLVSTRVAADARGAALPQEEMPQLRLPLLVKCYSRLGGNASKATNGQLLKLVRYSAPLSPLGGLAIAEVQLAKAEAFVALSVGEALPRRARAAQEVALAAEAARARQQAASEAQLRLQ